MSSGRRDSARACWMAAAVASSPLVVAIIGWAQSWNVHTNLMLTLSSVVLWVVIWRSWKTA